MKRSQKFSSTNTLELMLENGLIRSDPRKFFQELACQTVIVLALPGEGQQISIETSQPIDGIKYAFIYTSEKALNYILQKKKSQSRNTAELIGRDLINILLNEGLGMQINAEIYDNPVLCKPDNLEFIVEQLNSPRRTE